MNEERRSVLYAGGLQFCFPGGLGRFYLKNRVIGLLQFLTSFIIVGYIWSWIDGYFIVTRQHKIRRKKVNLIYHEILSNKENILPLNSENFNKFQLFKNKSPIAAPLLQLFCFGLGRIYRGYWFIGILQLIFTFLFCLFLPFKHFVTHFVIDGWAILDSYCIFKGYQMNSSKEPFGYSVALNHNKVDRGPKDRLIAGMLQLFFPGLGRCYMGYWVPGILQFLTSFIFFIGVVWSWIDGHHIIVSSGIDKDGEGNLLTDQYRIN